MARPKAVTADLSRIMDSGAKLDGGTLGRKLVDVLEQAILSGELQPGERIGADTIAEHFGVSRVPVREAFRSLEAEGWIRQVPRQGYYIGSKSLTEMADLFEARLLLEPEAASLAAERRSGDDIAELERILQRSKDEIERKDIGAISRSNQDLHAVIAQATGNSILQSTLIRLGKSVRFYTASANSRRTTAMKEHAELIDAIRRRDAVAARQVATEHVMHTRSALDEALLIRQFGDQAQTS